MLEPHVIYAKKQFTFGFKLKTIVERWALKQIPFWKLSLGFQFILDSHLTQRDLSLKYHPQFLVYKYFGPLAF